MSDTDLQLLAQYARDRKEDAFTELVRRHLDLVHSAALRQVRSPQLAEEVAQSAFTDLARNADTLLRADSTPSSGSLTPWLYAVTRRTAIDVVRREARRQAREQVALTMNTEPAGSPLAAHASDPPWADIEPLLDEAVCALDDADRAAVLLRYFEDRSLRDVGHALGTSDDAAQKRVSRAVERLREFLAKRGTAVSASGLAVAISAHAVQAAPAGLALAISTAAAFSGTAVSTTAIASITKGIAMTALQKTLVTATVAILAGAGIYEARQAAQLRHENEQLRAHQEQLTAARDTALATAAAGTDELARLRKDQTDLLRLRNEVGALRRQTNDVARIRYENRQLRTSLADAAQTAHEEDAEEDSDPQRQLAITKMNDAKLLVLGLMMHAANNQDRLPTDLSQTTNYWANTDHSLSGTNEFELILQGSLAGITNPGSILAVREKEPSLINGKWIKTYGFADGHSEVKVEPPEGFEAWENEHLQPAPSGP